MTINNCSYGVHYHGPSLRAPTGIILSIKAWRWLSLDSGLVVNNGMIITRRHCGKKEQLKWEDYISSVYGGVCSKR